MAQRGGQTTIPRKNSAGANLKPERRYYQGYWMAYRLIARSMDYRTLIATIVPPGFVCGHSIAIAKISNKKSLCFLCGIINSFVADWFMRQKVSANVTMFNFLELPVPRLTSGKEFDAIARKTAQLVSAAPGFADLKKEVGIEHCITSENDRALARAQLDYLAAQVYGITKEEMEHILQSFPLVEAKQKEMVLAQF